MKYCVFFEFLLGDLEGYTTLKVEQIEKKNILGTDEEFGLMEDRVEKETYEEDKEETNNKINLIKKELEIKYMVFNEELDQLKNEISTMKNGLSRILGSETEEGLLEDIVTRNGYKILEEENTQLRKENTQFSQYLVQISSELETIRNHLKIRPPSPQPIYKLTLWKN